MEDKDKNKDKIDVLELLRKASMERYSWRAGVEWKLCIALWTALAAFIGAALTGKEAAHPKIWVIWAISVVIILLPVLHGFWLHGLDNTRKLDNECSFFFRDQIMKKAGIEFSPSIQTRIDNENDKAEKRKWWWHWSIRFQLGVTVVLSFGAVAAVFSVATDTEREKPARVDTYEFLNLSQGAAFDALRVDKHTGELGSNIGWHLDENKHESWCS